MSGAAQPSRKPRALRCVSEFEVPFHDVDGLGIVWHGNYFKYLEIARTKLLRELGLGRLEHGELGYRWVVYDASCRYSASLRFGERFTVTAWLQDVEHRIGIQYLIEREGARIARAFTALATLDSSGALLLLTPPELLQYLLEPEPSPGSPPASPA